MHADSLPPRLRAALLSLAFLFIASSSSAQQTPQGAPPAPGPAPPSQPAPGSAGIPTQGAPPLGTPQPAPAPTPGPVPAATPAPYAPPPQEVAPPPQQPGYYRPVRVRRTIKGLVIGGSITFGVSWGLSLLVTLSLLESSCTDCASKDVAQVLWIPVFGPALASRADATDEGIVNVFWFGWSLIQAAGVTMFTLGMIGREVDEDPRNVTGNWQLSPLVGPKQAGLSLSRAW